MPQPRPYAVLMVALSLPLLLVSFWSVHWDRWEMVVLAMLAVALLANRFHINESGVVETATAPWNTALMTLFHPMEMFALSFLGPLVVKFRVGRPWPNTFINITAVGGGLWAGASVYRGLLAWFGLQEGSFIQRLLPFLVSMVVRDLVNYSLIAPVVAKARASTPGAVVWRTISQNGWGQYALNGTGLLFADLIRREGHLAIIYSALVIVGIHTAVLAYVRRQAAEQSALQDGLTLVRNRTTYERAALAPNWKGVVAVIDCDGLKQVNDEQGHQAGDLMLQTLARSLMQMAGRDRVYRYGGDEFVLLLDRSHISGLDTVLHRCRSEHGISASHGFCEVPNEAPDIPTAFSIADDRMYTQKRTGRLVADSVAASSAPWQAPTGCPPLQGHHQCPGFHAFQQDGASGPLDGAELPGPGRYQPVKVGEELAQVHVDMVVRVADRHCVGMLPPPE